ncbi:MAG: nucleotide pyrophosphohydrolase [Candidatus Hodarchaeota archaeon]
MDSEKISLEDLTRMIREFVHARDWESFQKPSALAVSASVEMGELLELFQWLSEDEIRQYLEEEEYREALAGELSDVAIYLLRIADTTGIDLTQAIINKMRKNEEKYPADEWRGRIPSKTEKST